MFERHALRRRLTVNEPTCRKTIDNKTPFADLMHFNVFVQIRAKIGVLFGGNLLIVRQD